MAEDAQEETKPDMTSTQPLWSSDVYGQPGQNPSSFRAQDGWYAPLSSSRQLSSRDQSTSFDPGSNLSAQTLALPAGNHAGPAQTRTTTPLMQMQHHMFDRGSWPPGGSFNHGTVPTAARQDFGIAAPAHQGGPTVHSHNFGSSRHEMHQTTNDSAPERSAYHSGQEAQSHAHNESPHAQKSEDKASETTTPLTFLSSDDDDARDEGAVASSSKRPQLPPAAQAVELAPEMKRQAPRSDGGPRRPMNAFLLFSRYRRKEVQLAGGSTITTAQFSAMLGQEWRSLSDDRRKFWQDQAMQVRDQFNRQFPTYRYSRTKKKVKGADKGKYSLAGGYAYSLGESSREPYAAVGSTMNFPSSQYPYQQAGTSTNHGLTPLALSFPNPQPNPYAQGMWSAPASAAGSTPGSTAVSPNASFYTRPLFQQAESERDHVSPHHSTTWSERRASAAFMGQQVTSHPALYASFPRVTTSAAPPSNVPLGMHETRADEIGSVGQTRHMQGAWGWTTSARPTNALATVPTGSAGYESQHAVAGYPGGTSNLQMGSGQDAERSGSVPRYLSIQALSNTQATQDWRRSLGSFTIPSTEGLPRRALTNDSTSLQADRRTSMLGVDLPYSHAIPGQSASSTDAPVDQTSTQYLQHSFSLPQQPQADSNMSSAYPHGLEAAGSNLAAVDEDRKIQDNLGIMSVSASPTEASAATPAQERANFLRSTILTTPAFPSQPSGQAPSNFPEDGYTRQ